MRSSLKEQVFECFSEYPDSTICQIVELGVVKKHVKEIRQQRMAEMKAAGKRVPEEMEFNATSMVGVYDPEVLSSVEKGGKNYDVDTNPEKIVVLPREDAGSYPDISKYEAIVTHGKMQELHTGVAQIVLKDELMGQFKPEVPNSVIGVL